MIVPPDFGIVETTIPFGETTRLLDKRPRPELIDPEEMIRQPDWTFFYIGFGLSSLLAIHWYRRGAT